MSQTALVPAYATLRAPNVEGVLDLAPGAARALRLMVEWQGLDLNSPELEGVREFIAAAESLDGSPVAASASPAPVSVPTDRTAGARDLAKLQGYEGEACGSCQNFTLVRNGTCLKCNTCGSTSGCS